MKFIRTTAFAVVLFAGGNATADARPDGHAPLGVMGDHVHNKGEFMFSYRYMQMSMQGNRDGTGDISPQEIATTQANRFAGMPSMAPTLRVVPTDMTMSMHMLGLMYAPTDRVTLMGMVKYLENEMDHVSFAGGAGRNLLGSFTTKSRGIGDTIVTALVKLGETASSRWHATLGVSLPTGDIERSDRVLTPMNTQPKLRLPYPMQLGSGTYDLITGMTYGDHEARWGWGGQWRSQFRLDKNDEDYTLGDRHQVQGWVSYLLYPRLSASARFEYIHQGGMDGIDPLIRAPVQTADPDRQGFDRIDLGMGINFSFADSGHRLALELSRPVYQDLNGPQLETDWSVVLGWQYAG